MKNTRQNLKLTDEFWQNVPVQDAVEPLVLFPKMLDLQTATPGDPENCVYAKCVKRVIPKARRVRIWRSVALVESRNSAGETIALRYSISKNGQKVLKNFDQGVGELKPCSLLVPSRCRTLSFGRARDKQRRENNRERIAKRGKEISLAKTAGTHKPNRQIKSQADLFIRNGSGHHNAFGV